MSFEESKMKLKKELEEKRAKELGEEMDRRVKGKGQDRSIIKKE